MASEECFKLWMEAEVNYGAELDNKIGVDNDCQGRPFLSARSAREGEDRSSGAHDALPETYVERQSEVSTRPSEDKDSGEVASSVVRRTDVGGVVKLCGTRSLPQTGNPNLTRGNHQLRQGEFPLSVLDRKTVPPSCQAGIPGGVDAGERVSLPMSLTFDEDEELAGANHGGSFLVNSPALELGKRTRSGDSWNHKQGEASSGTNNCKSGSISKKKRRKTRRSSREGNEIVHALRGFAKVIAQVEEARVEIMKDLEKRRKDLQMKIANYDPNGDMLGETFSPAAPLILL